MGSPIWATVTLPTHYMPIPAISLVAVNGAGGMSFGARTPGHSQDFSGIGICNRHQYIARWRLLVSKGWGRIYAFYGRCGLPKRWRTMANWEGLKIWAAISDDANGRKEMGQKPKQTREEP